MCVFHGINQGNYRKMEDGDSRLRRELHPHIPKDRKHKTLYIYTNQLMYDIDAKVSMLTSSRRGQDGTESNVNTDMLDKYKGMFDRWISKHVGKVKEQLIIAVIDNWNGSMGDELKEQSEYAIHLAMPSWWDETAWKSLVETVHDYLVNAVLSEYYKIILTAKDPVTITTMEDADDSYGKIKVLLCMHRAGDIKRPLRPMGF